MPYGACLFDGYLKYPASHVVALDLRLLFWDVGQEVRKRQQANHKLTKCSIGNTLSQVLPLNMARLSNV
jgi:hypothetical protein